MGCSISVYFANTFLANRMSTLHSNPPRDLLYLGRYIDDVVGIWIGEPEPSLKELFAQVTCESIKLTWVWSRSSLVVLDLVIHLDEGQLSTTVHPKPTDGHQFVHWSSAHPRHIKRSIPYAQLLRMRRICSKEEEFKKEAARLLRKFSSRGYPKDVLSQALTEASKRTREALLKPTEDPAKTGDRLYFVTEYREETHRRIKQASDGFHASLLEHPLVTERAETLGSVPIPTAAPRVSFRLNRSLGAGLGKLFKFLNF